MCVRACVRACACVCGSRAGIFCAAQRTEFEGPGWWPFETDGRDDHSKVWPRDKGRFALYADGHEEVPAAAAEGGGAAQSE